MEACLSLISTNQDQRDSLNKQPSSKASLVADVWYGVRKKGRLSLQTRMGI